MKTYKKAFTLVELLVVITILTIISGISLVSYNWYISWVRDSNRISQISSIYTWLNSYKIKNTIPLPDDKINILWSWSEIISYQWIAWQTVLDTISFKKWWKDPKDWLHYTYYTSKNRKYFQLMALVEENDSLYSLNNNLVSKSYAEELDYSDRFIYTYWDNLWVLTITWTNIPINFVNSIRAVGNLNINTTTNSYTATFYEDVSISWDSSILSDLETVISIWWKWCSFDSNTITCP